jgi:hypothetical protein
MSVFVIGHARSGEHKEQYRDERQLTFQILDNCPENARLLDNYGFVHLLSMFS